VARLAVDRRAGRRFCHQKNRTVGKAGGFHDRRFSVLFESDGET
jgi:hypothetical protein